MTRKAEAIDVDGYLEEKTCDLMMGCASVDIPDGNREDLRWIDYPAPRSADSFVMAGPIRHCLLRA